MYNLEVARAESFVVGSRGWVVHNGRKLTESYSWGGPHKNTKIGGKQLGTESHHLLADAVSPFKTDHGPAIRMPEGDHADTGSYKNSNASKAWRGLQKDLIDLGKFDEALQMGIDDLEGKFGDTYKPHIQEMLQGLPKKSCGAIDWSAIPVK
jgi:hypothetical protein